jgi:uncharacterized membrane protein YbhN (UPF0104 family)
LTWEILAGAAFLLLPLPWLFAFACDAVGWRGLLLREGVSLPLTRLAAVRFVSEALGAILPSGAAVGDAAALGLLARAAPGVSPFAVFASLATRRLFCGASQALYLLVCAAAVWSLGGTPASAGLLLAGATALGVVTCAFRATVLHGKPAERLAAALHRIPFYGLRRRLRASVPDARQADRRLAAAFSSLGLRDTWRGLPFFGLWMGEALETYCMLRLLGADVPLPTVLSFEGLVALARGAAFFLPGGLLVQDAGYVSALLLQGVPGALALGAQLAGLKRARELLAAATAAALLPFLLRPGRPRHEPSSACVVRLRVPEPDHADA